MDNFIKLCHKKLNLHHDFILNQCDPNSISYIQPFCLDRVENPLIGYIHVSVIIIHVLMVSNKNTIFHMNLLFLRKNQPKNLSNLQSSVLMKKMTMN